MIYGENSLWSSKWTNRKTNCIYSINEITPSVVFNPLLSRNSYYIIVDQTSRISVLSSKISCSKRQPNERNKVQIGLGIPQGEFASFVLWNPGLRIVVSGRTTCSCRCCISPPTSV